MAKQIDIIIPVYNEEENLPVLVERIDQSLKKAKLKYTVIIIDDHSTDKTMKVVQQLQKKFSIIYQLKQGPRGKAYSILEAAQLGEAELMAMIDADLQYPPEVIPDMINLMETHGVVVARRKSSDDKGVRHLASKGFQFFFGKVLYGLGCDIQSGLKVFRRDTIQHLDAKDVTAWTVDIPLLHTALEQGYSIGEVDIHFAKRERGESKIKLLQSIKEIGGHAVRYKLKNKKPITVKPSTQSNMVGAGIVHKKRSFITHTTLDHQQSALTTFTTGQKIAIAMIIFTLLFGFLLNFVTTLKIFVGILSFLYFADVLFNLFLILRSLHTPPELTFSKKELATLKPKDLPVYTILCPLYREANVLPHFLDSIAKLDWPKNKLDVILLLEEDDQETIEMSKQLKMPKYVRTLIVPDSQPKTKPKACNYGLNFAKGEYLVIYDAEDIPDPLQLKKVYLGFQRVPANIRCLQAKLNYHNPHQNLLTRFFTAEYSLWFDVVLTGLQSINTTIPLGGTSNHFKTEDLKTLQGWDPFNVTEDCDLGVRLFKRGYKTAIVDSVTLEEANSNWRNWLRQRSRWIKGYMQTYLIHMRHPLYFFRKNGFHALLFQLIVGGKLAFMFINPIMWMLTISYFALYAYVGETIETFFPTVVFYMAISSLIFGNFMFIYYYMIGTAKRGHWPVIKWVFLVPVYWLMVSWAACIALKQLITNPHYWEKTIHGLHLQKKKVEKEIELVSKAAVASVLSEAVQLEKPQPSPRAWTVSVSRIRQFLKIRSGVHYKRDWKRTIREVVRGKYRGGSLLVVASVLANFMNMVTNFYLGRELNLTDFAIFNAFLSLLNILSIFMSALSTTVNQQAALIFGKINQSSAKNFWSHVKNRVLFVSMIGTLIWLIILPVTSEFMNLHSIIPLLLFSPAILVGGVNAVNQGYLRGSLSFELVAATTFILPLSRLFISVLLGESQFDHFAYVSIPASMVIATLLSHYFARQGNTADIPHKQLKLPKTFFMLALVSNLSSIAYFSLDNILVMHYLSNDDAALYGLMGLLGKMIFFTGGLITGFILPLTAYREGKGLSSEDIFKKLIILASSLSFLAFLVFGIAIPFVSPDIFGEKMNAIRPYLPFYSLGILFYTISQAIVQFHLAKKHYIFATTSFFLAMVQVLGLMLFNNNLLEITMVMTASGVVNFFILALLHRFYLKLAAPLGNLRDLTDLLFGRIKFHKKELPLKTSYRVLIFNWRDTKHVWAGGAEAYIHEIAKGLTKQGHKVTVFCGNDGKNPRNEVVDEIQIIRRGGFYTVYIWAFLYYVLKLRHYFDIVIDSENGIPFLTPFYVRKPIFLLIHHVHQQVFREQLKFPLSEIASIIEADIMPFAYKNHSVITVSESSKKEIIDLGLGSAKSIQVINPGIDSKLFKIRRKTSYPSLIYVGRLKPYKNLDVAIKAFALVVQKYPKAIFTIAGIGESLKELKELVKKLKIDKSVKFLNSVSDKEKAKLFAQSWVAIQPSMIEGWGITVIEANASGTPVIASNVKGLKDSVLDGKTGILVKAQHFGEFADAIEQLFDHKVIRERMSKESLAWATNFSWDKSCEKLLAAIFCSVKKNETVTAKLFKPGRSTVASYDQR